MATLSAVKRLARLGWWVGLSTGAMVAAACGSLFSIGCNPSSLTARDAGHEAPVGIRVDAPTKLDAPVIVIQGSDAAAQEANEPVDGGKSDLWEIICE
jgi:hypothetical protein